MTDARRAPLAAERRAFAPRRGRNTLLAAILAVAIALARGGRSQARDGCERGARRRRRFLDRRAPVRRRRVPGALEGPRPTRAPHAMAVSPGTPTWTLR
jgi:hypothetical protein